MNEQSQKQQHQQNQTEAEMIPIGVDETFTFSCNPDVACFNECCGDLNQFLTPYDILRLKNRLEISAGQFLERYTTEHIGPESGLPIVRFREIGSDRFKCPFVTQSGCSVYEDRPSSCRGYPVARVVSRDRVSGKLTEHFFLIREPHCLGFQGSGSQTVDDWMRGQGLLVYNEMNDLLMDIIKIKNSKAPGPLDLALSRLIHTGFYDLDTFRKKVFTDNTIDLSKLDEKLVFRAQSDETALLRLSMAYVKNLLGG